MSFYNELQMRTLNRAAMASTLLIVGAAFSITSAIAADPPRYPVLPEFAGKHYQTECGSPTVEKGKALCDRTTALGGYFYGRHVSNCDDPAVGRGAQVILQRSACKGYEDDYLKQIAARR